MKRATPFLSKCPSNWIEATESMMSETMFLVSRNGPMAFMVKEECGRVFRCTLGEAL